MSYPVVMGPHDYTGRLRFYIDHILQDKPMNVDDLDFYIELFKICN